MTKLERSVKSCLHNTDNRYCKIAIVVGGSRAKTVEQTCCASSNENKGGRSTNLFRTPEAGLEVICDAVECTYNEEHRRNAKRVDISDDEACKCTETRYSTLRAK